MKPSHRIRAVLVGALALAAGAALLRFGLREWSPLGFPEARVLGARIAIAVGAIPFAQAGVRLVRHVLGKCLEAGAPDEPRNRRTTVITGVVENALFPWILFGVGPGGAAGIGGWIGFKMAGNWTSWQTSNDPHSTQDRHIGRRRMYVFLLCNAWQVLAAVIVAWLLKGVK
jgi:hypothetical protein